MDEKLLSLAQIIDNLDFQMGFEIFEPFLISNLLLVNGISYLAIFHHVKGVLSDDSVSIDELPGDSNLIYSRDWKILGRFSVKLNIFLELLIEIRENIRKFSQIDNSQNITFNLSRILGSINDKITPMNVLLSELRDIDKNLVALLLDYTYWRSDIRHFTNYIIETFYNMNMDSINLEILTQFYRVFLKCPLPLYIYPNHYDDYKFILATFQEYISLWFTNLKRAAEDIFKKIEQHLNGSQDHAQLEHLIKAVESIRFDRKRKVTPSIQKAISAFANTQGGIILVGQDDDKNLYNISNPDRDIQTINQYANNIDPPVEINVSEHKYQNYTLLVVQIPKSDDLHQSNSIYYKRKNRDCVPMKDKEIKDRILAKSH